MYHNVSVLGCILRGLYYGQRYLIYPLGFAPFNRLNFPFDDSDPYSLKTYGRIRKPCETLELKTRDNVTLKCFLLTQDTPHTTELSEEDYVASCPTVILFHGNASNVLYQGDTVLKFFKLMKCNVLAMTYRGYAGSTGSPTETGLQIDAQTGLDYITSHAVLKRSRLIVYGQSLGGGVAIDLVSKNTSKVHALIVENTFSSLPHVIRDNFPPILRHFHFLVHQRWNSLKKIPQIPSSINILMLSGQRDQLIPPSHMQALREAVEKRPGGSESAKFVEFSQGGHNDTSYQYRYWETIYDFIHNFPDESSDEYLLQLFLSCI